jgi:hypothetical protein
LHGAGFFESNGIKAKRMFKRNVIIPLALAVLALLAWLFHAQIAELASLPPESVAIVRNWATIVAAPFTVISGVVALINFLRNKPAPPTPKEIQDYYSALRKTCERIDLSLVDTKFTEYARNVESSITLPVVYQEMEASAFRSEREGEAEHGGERMRPRGEDGKPLTEAAAEDKYRHLVILGDPGAGKSMFIDNLAWRIAGSHIKQLDERLPKEFLRLPLARVRLRSAALLCKREGFGPSFLLDAMEREIIQLIGEEESGKRIWRALQGPLLEHGLILLDGLDEVPEIDGLRARMLEAIDELVGLLEPQARVIVTSRPYVFDGTQASWLDAFGVLEIQPMSDARIEEFIDRWYRLLRETRGRTEAVARQSAHRLYLELQDRDYLLEPARRPLILTLLTSLHFARDVLPHSRAELYHEAIGLMLERWTQRIYRENPEYPLDDYERKALRETDVTRKTALQKLAMEANKDKTLQIQDYKIKGLFSDVLSADCNANNLLDFIRYRSGILKPGQGKTFEFYHRSFQDYLAALDITEMHDWQDAIERLLRTEGKDWWGEAFLLLVSVKVAGASKPDAVALLARFIPETLDYANYPGEEWQWLFLAARALIEQQKPLQGYQSQHYLKLRANLTRHLLALTASGHDYRLPVALRAEAGRLLGEFGDPRPGVGARQDERGKPRIFVLDGKRVKLPDIVWEDIPAGTFMMGTVGDEGHDAEKPAHAVTLPAFRLSRYPVTNAQFACFVEAGGYEDEQYWRTKAALAWLRGGKADL